MWILFARAPHPDAAYWPGRRWLALMDGLAWPTLVLWVIAAGPIGGVIRMRSDASLHGYDTQAHHTRIVHTRTQERV